MTDPVGQHDFTYVVFYSKLSFRDEFGHNQGPRRDCHQESMRYVN